VEIREGAWKIPPIFAFLKKTGEVPPRTEMYRVLQHGVGCGGGRARRRRPHVLKDPPKAGEKAGPSARSSRVTAKSTFWKPEKSAFVPGPKPI